MDPDIANCMISRIHVEKIIIINPSHAIKQQTSVRARYGSKKLLKTVLSLEYQLRKILYWDKG